MNYLLQGQFLAVAFTLLTLFFVGRVLHKQQRQGVSMAWILAIFLIPYVGIPAYILFGGRKLKQFSERKSTLYASTESLIPRLLEFDNPAEDVLTSEHVPPPTAKNRIDFVSNGEEAFARIMELIAKAETSIYIETFILGRDDVAGKIVELLEAKARAGVDVRLLLDSYGSLGSSGRFLRELREAGGQVATFMPLLPFKKNWSLNLRNHRKMLLVDCVEGMIGGMNFADEYMGPEPDADRWVDTVSFIHGPAAIDLMEVFISDWNFASRNPIAFDRACLAVSPEPNASDIAQVAATGPDVAGDPVYEAILASMYAVKDRIWVVTPYFIPGDELFRALLMQARIGRDVRLLVPYKSNHFLADLARGRYLRELKKAGGKIYLYPDRMIHAKHVIFDSDTAVMGSVNIDMRSLYINFEVAVFAYSADQIDTLARWMTELFDESLPLGDEEPPRMRQLAEELTFLVSPLL